MIRIARFGAALSASVLVVVATVIVCQPLSLVWVSASGARGSSALPRGNSSPFHEVHAVFPSKTICVHMPPLMFAASVTVTKAREAKTWAEKRSHKQMTRSCKRLRSVAMSVHDSCRLRRNCPRSCTARGGRNAAKRARLRLSMSQVRKTRKGEWRGHGMICVEVRERQPWLCRPTHCSRNAHVSSKTNRVNSSNKQQHVLWCRVQNQEPRSASIASSTHRFHSLALCGPPSKKKKPPVKSCCTTVQRSKRAFTISTICSWICGTGTLTASTVSSMICGSGTSTIWCRICGTGTSTYAQRSSPAHDSPNRRPELHVRSSRQTEGNFSHTSARKCC